MTAARVLVLCHQQHDEFALPVIIVAMATTDADVLAGFAHGADNYVTRPFNELVLLSRLRAVTRHHRRYSRGDQATGT